MAITSRVLIVAALGTTALSSSLLASPAFATQQAQASDAVEPAQAAQPSGGLEEIVVTARKREENLQSTPLSVSAFGGEALAQRGVQQVSDVTSYVPNVQFDSAASESGGGASTQISIRGIGQADYVLTVEPAVGVYLDGVYIGKSVGSLLDTVDIDRLEVLRGPQGTLFGRNTIGGAVQLVSKRPSKTPEFFVEGTTGSFNRIDVKTGFSMPINDALRIRMSGAYIKRDGDITRVDAAGKDTGLRDGNENKLSGRFAAELDVAPNLLATLALDGTHIRERSSGSVQLFVDENGGFAAAFNAGVPGGVCLASAGAARFSNPFCYNTQYVRSVASRTTANQSASRSDVDVWGAGLTFNWNLGAASIKSISAYRNVKAEIAHELTGSPYYVNAISQSISTEQFSQEFQLTGKLFDDRLDYVVGLFYLREQGRQVFPVYNSIVQFDSGGDIKNDSFAAFGQATYRLTDSLSFTGGLRYTNESRTFNPGLQHIVSYSSSPGLAIPGFVDVLAGAFGPPGTPIFPAGNYKRTSNAVTPMATLNYQFTPDLMAYASYSKGFKGGGFTMRYFPPVVPAAGTDPNSIVSYAGPEKATSYELGLKTELLDRHLRFNIAGFYTDYRDIQVTYNIDPDGAGPIGAFVPVLANAGTAHIKGVEIESSLAATKWLRIDGSLGYIDAKYTHLAAQVLATYPDVHEFKLPNTPKWTANIGATLTFVDDAKSGRAWIRADYGYRSGQFKDFTNNPYTYQGAYGILNASVSYRLPGRAWQVTAGGTNLTNEAYLVSAVSNPGLGIVQGVPSRPREWYLKLRYQY